MSFAFIIFIRVLFVACMVFILGYIFGSFGKRPVLKTISRIAAILVIVLFIAMNILFVRAAISGGWHRGPWQEGGRHGCGPWQQEYRFKDKGEEPRRDSLQRPLSGNDPVPQGGRGSGPVSGEHARPEDSQRPKAAKGQQTSSTTLTVLG